MHTCHIDLEPDPRSTVHDPPARVGAWVAKQLVVSPGVEHLRTRTAADRIRLTAFLDATGPVTALPLIVDLRCRAASLELGGWRLVPDRRSRPRSEALDHDC